MTFEYKFLYDYDVVFFAPFVPYTYTDLIHHLARLEASPAYEDKLRIDYLYNSLGKLPVYGLTITSKIMTNYVHRDKEMFKW